MQTWHVTNKKSIKLEANKEAQKKKQLTIQNAYNQQRENIPVVCRFVSEPERGPSDGDNSAERSADAG